MSPTKSNLTTGPLIAPAPWTGAPFMGTPTKTSLQTSPRISAVSPGSPSKLGSEAASGAHHHKETSPVKPAVVLAPEVKVVVQHALVQYTGAPFIRTPASSTGGEADPSLTTLVPQTPALVATEEPPSDSALVVPQPVVHFVGSGPRTATEAPLAAVPVMQVSSFGAPFMGSPTKVMELPEVAAKAAAEAELAASLEVVPAPTVQRIASLPRTMTRNRVAQPWTMGAVMPVVEEVPVVPAVRNVSDIQAEAEAELQQEQPLPAYSGAPFVASPSKAEQEAVEDEGAVPVVAPEVLAVAEVQPVVQPRSSPYAGAPLGATPGTFVDGAEQEAPAEPEVQVPAPVVQKVLNKAPTMTRAPMAVLQPWQQPAAASHRVPVFSRG